MIRELTEEMKELCPTVLPSWRMFRNECFDEEMHENLQAQMFWFDKRCWLASPSPRSFSQCFVPLYLTNEERYSEGTCEVTTSEDCSVFAARERSVHCEVCGAPILYPSKCPGPQVCFLCDEGGFEDILA
jgi:hypothetical protein